mgnify:CR=1 FL=1
MMKRTMHILFPLLCLLVTTVASAQEKPSGLGETMRSNGRIYVVVGVILIILAGLILYVVRLDRKISRLEKEKH